MQGIGRYKKVKKKKRLKKKLRTKKKVLKKGSGLLSKKEENARKKKTK